MEKALSDDEIRPHIKNIITYGQLRNMSSGELLNIMPVAILYNTGPNYGHWTLLHKTIDGIEFFDSYGFKPDREFGIIDTEWQQPYYLLALLKDMSSKYPIHFNQYGLQEKKRGINTCGRWIILRHMFSNKNIDDFVKGVDKTARELGMSKDELLVNLV